MKVQELLDKLIEAITADEWNRLKHGDSSLVISSFNREVLLSMSSTSAENFEIDTKSIRNLHEALQQLMYRSGVGIMYELHTFSHIPPLLATSLKC